jgi:hypothetical protein
MSRSRERSVAGSDVAIRRNLSKEIATALRASQRLRRMATLPSVACHDVVTKFVAFILVFITEKNA